MNVMRCNSPISVQDLQNHEDKVAEVNNLAEQLVADEHPEEETIRQKQQVGPTSTKEMGFTR